MHNVRQKVAVVTGATGALGSAMASMLAAKGYRVVLLARNADTAEALASRIQGARGQAEVRLGDLSDLESARGLAADLSEGYPAIDLLVNNAAVFSKEREVTGDGFELMFATNHLGPFILTNALVGSLQAAAPARIVTISAPTTTKLDFEDLQGAKQFSAFRAFGASKMCNLLSTFRLAKTLDPSQVTANVVHPGLIKSGLMAEASPLITGLLNLVSKSPEKLAGNPVWVGTSPDIELVTGKFFKGRKLAEPASYSREEPIQDRLWQASEALAASAQ